MAKENVKNFFEEVSKSEDLQKQLKTATEKTNAEVQKLIEAQTESVVEVAKKAGFEFTAEELLSSAQQGDKKLDQNELDAVAGGWVGATCCCLIGMGVGFGCSGGGSYCALLGLGAGCTDGGM